MGKNAVGCLFTAEMSLSDTLIKTSRRTYIFRGSQPSKEAKPAQGPFLQCKENEKPMTSCKIQNYQFNVVIQVMEFRRLLL